jgi:hypothetical protein
MVVAAKLAARVKRRYVALGAASPLGVVYENEGIRGVNEGGFENFATMRKGLVDRTHKATSNRPRCRVSG